MRRREFITLLGGAAAAWPLLAGAQRGKVARIGFLGNNTYYGEAKFVEAFRAGLRDLGYVEGGNFNIDFRWAEGRYERLPELAAELARLKVDVIVTSGTPGTRAAKQATTTIPIVMASSADAVATGIVASLNRPGGNITGSTIFGPELNAKRLELVKEALPRASQIAVLINADNFSKSVILQTMEPTAAYLKVKLQQFPVQTPNEFEDAFAAMGRNSVDALTLDEDSMFLANIKRIAELATKNRLPSISGRDLVEAGGLMGYGVNILDLYRRAASFVDTILKGAKPADLPVELATRFEFIINMKTAKMLGLDVPATVLVRADELIE